jgi:hypothetical protein
MPTVDIPMTSDAYLDSASPTANTETEATMYVGEQAGGTDTTRTWIKPDFSTIPTGAIFTSAVLHLTPIVDLSSNARTMSAHRCLRDVVANQVTWNIWKTSNNWATAGCSNSSSDYDGAVVLGTMTQPASPTLNTALDMTLSASNLQKLFDGTYTNNGIILFVDTQSDDMIGYASTNHATSAYRPTITITYTTGGGFFLFF